MVFALLFSVLPYIRAPCASPTPSFFRMQNLENHAKMRFRCFGFFFVVFAKSCSELKFQLSKKLEICTSVAWCGYTMAASTWRSSNARALGARGARGALPVRDSAAAVSRRSGGRPQPGCLHPAGQRCVRGLLLQGRGRSFYGDND